MGEARPDYQIIAELARRLGHGHLYPQSPEEVLDYVLDGSGFTRKDLMRADRHVIRQPSVPMEYRKWELGLLRKDGRPGFETPTGKFEIRSTILEHYGYEGLPKYEESDETPIADPELAKTLSPDTGNGDPSNRT